MRRNRVTLMWLVVAVMPLWLSFSPVEAAAQNEVSETLAARLRQQGLPVKDLRVGDWPSAGVQVVLQSASPTDRVAPEDPGHEHAVDREMALALRDGIGVAQMDLTIVNTDGKPIHWTLGMPVNRAFVERAFPASKTGEADVAEWLREALPLHGLALADVTVTRDADGWDDVSVRLSATDVASANASLPGFMRDTLDRVEAFNAREGGPIAIVRVELADEKGQLLLRHVRDYQLQQEHWWQAEGMTDEWFPSPLPAEPADR